MTTNQAASLKIGSRIVCREHLDWGSFIIQADEHESRYGYCPAGQFIIRHSGRSGGRMLDKTEALTHWELENS